MSISHLLESFDGLRQNGPALHLSEDSLEAQKLEAFEHGYKAGWDDAARAQSDETNRLTTDFGENLKELAFTYHEAYGHMARSLEPMLRGIMDAILPDLARQSLGARLVEQLQKAASEQARSAVEIVVSPANAPALGDLLGAVSEFPVQLVSEASLGDGQAFLRFADGEQQVDLDTVLGETRAAIDAYFNEVNDMIAKEA